MKSNEYTYPKSGALIVSWDFEKDGNGVFIVGERKNGRFDIVNAFSGEEAIKRITMLLERKAGDEK